MIKNLKHPVATASGKNSPKLVVDQKELVQKNRDLNTSTIAMYEHISKCYNKWENKLKHQLKKCKKYQQETQKSK